MSLISFGKELFQTKLRARAQDPISSIQAAENAALFAGTHKERIVAALERAQSATAHQIADMTGLTVVQVDRRLPELARDKVAAVVQSMGEDVIRDGFRVWALQKNLTDGTQNVSIATNA